MIWPNSDWCFPTPLRPRRPEVAPSMNRPSAKSNRAESIDGLPLLVKSPHPSKHLTCGALLRRSERSHRPRLRSRSRRPREPCHLLQEERHFRRRQTVHVQVWEPDGPTYPEFWATPRRRWRIAFADGSASVLPHLSQCAFWLHSLVPRSFGYWNSRPPGRIFPHWTSGGISAGDYPLGGQPLGSSARSSRARAVPPACVSGRLDVQCRLRGEDHLELRRVGDGEH